MQNWSAEILWKIIISLWKFELQIWTSFYGVKSNEWKRLINIWHVSLWYSLMYLLILYCVRFEFWNSDAWFHAYIDFWYAKESFLYSTFLLILGIRPDTSKVTLPNLRQNYNIFDDVTILYHDWLHELASYSIHKNKNPKQRELLEMLE